jgi:hypothetical protein
MSKDSLEATFKQNAGLPEVENKKRLNKKAAQEKKLFSKLQKTFFTLVGGKLLKKIAKPKGVHTIFIGREKMIKKEQLKTMISQWEKDGSWLPSHMLEETLSAVVKDLYKQQEALKK